MTEAPVTISEGGYEAYDRRKRQAIRDHAPAARARERAEAAQAAQARQDALHEQLRAAAAAGGYYGFVPRDAYASPRTEMPGDGWVNSFNARYRK